MTQQIQSAYSIYEKAIKYHVGKQCGSYAFCYMLLKLAHNKLPANQKAPIFNKLKEDWHLSNKQIVQLLKKLRSYSFPEEHQPPKGYFMKKYYF